MPDSSQTPSGVPLDDFALETQDTTQVVRQPSSEDTTSTVPAKYAGKTVDDLISMHQNAERRLSQQGNELGEVRKLADQLIGVRTQENTKRVEARLPVTVDALLADPEKVLTQTIDATAGSRANAQEQRLNNLEISVAQRDFVSRHPSAEQDTNNPDFIEWIKKNPLRTQLASRAYNQDYGAANDLWSLWDEHKGDVGTAGAAAKTAQRKQTVQNATTSRGGNSEGTPPRQYSRAKLMELRMQVADGVPAAVARWNDEKFQAGLIQAYANGQVK